MNNKEFFKELIIMLIGMIVILVGYSVVILLFGGR